QPVVRIGPFECVKWDTKHHRNDVRAEKRREDKRVVEYTRLDLNACWVVGEADKRRPLPQCGFVRQMDRDRDRRRDASWPDDGATVSFELLIVIERDSAREGHGD